jgi:leader peptidase (prepilin peptidase)/N-methyltransferase
MSIVPALIAGVLGLAAGVPAGALVRRHCQEREAPPPGRWLVPALALALAALWAALALRLWPGHRAALAAYLALGFACVVLTVIDARTKLLPNRLTYPAFALVAALLLAASLVEGDPGRMLRALEAAAVMGVAFLLLALAVPRGLGLGDVKFAPTLGLALGWLSWGTVSVGVVAAFFLGGLVAVGALLVLRLGRGARLPFGPWMAAGALLAVLAGSQIAAWYGHALLGT